MTYNMLMGPLDPTHSLTPKMWTGSSETVTSKLSHDVDSDGWAVLFSATFALLGYHPRHCLPADVPQRPG